MARWWDRAGEIRFQLAELESAGISYELDGEVGESGVTVARILTPTDDGILELHVGFPDLFPYFRFEVFAPSLALTHHQNPFSKGLCLLGRGAVFQPRSDTLLRFLTERLPTLLTAAKANSPIEVDQLEEHQAEPVSEYFPYEERRIVLVDGSWQLPPGITSGTALLGSPSAGFSRGSLAVLQLFDRSNNSLFVLDARIATHFADSKVRCPWVKLLEFPLERDPLRFVDSVREGSHLVPRRKAGRKRQQELLLVTAPEEAAWRARTGTGWIGVAETAERRSRRTVRSAHFLRVARIGPEDLFERVPELSGLRRRTVTLVGLGSIGAPAALALAQAGAKELRLIDPDWLDPATIVRWPVGLSASGDLKSLVLRRRIEGEFPYTMVKAYSHRIGHHDNANDLEVLREALEGSDLLLDTTGEYSLQYFLSELGRQARVAFLSVAGTKGGWGGTLFRKMPGSSTGCWWCFQQCQRNGIIPEAPAAADLIQPQGCGDPTFTGSGFDMHSLALMGVRAAVEALCPEYPRGEWDAAIVYLRGSDGSAHPPEIRWYNVPKQEDCPSCGEEILSSG